MDRRLYRSRGGLRKHFRRLIGFKKQRQPEAGRQQGSPGAGSRQDISFRLRVIKGGIRIWQRERAWQ